MIRFQDGPAEGVVLELSRAPVMLRVLCGPGVKWDALDQLDDVAKPDEAIFLYRLTAPPHQVHLLCHHKGGRRYGRWTLSADYKHLNEQIDDAILRDNARWSDWCDANKERLLEGLQP